MGTMEGSYNTYIGARYVPIFDGNWDNTKAYEPLVIVQNQGNSYTSKTYVPVGADINDEKYWALTGNYNAQVEQYRQEVVQYEKDVKEYKKNSLNWINAVNIGCDKTGTTPINDIINNYQFKTGDILYFPHGEYLLNEILSFIDVSILGDNAKLTLNELKTHALVMQGNNIYLKGIEFNTNGKCVEFRNGSNVLVEDCIIHTQSIVGGNYQYGVTFRNCKQINCNRLIINQPINPADGSTANNADGIHIYGGCEDIFISNIVGISGDDLIAINSPEPTGNNASIKNVYISNVITMLNGVRSMRGIRIYANQYPIQNVNIENCYLATDNSANRPIFTTNASSQTGDENLPKCKIDRLYIANCIFDTPSQAIRTSFSEIGNLIVQNCVYNNPLQFHYSNDSNIGNYFADNLVVGGVFIQTTATNKIERMFLSKCALKNNAINNAGTIANLTIKECTTENLIISNSTVGLGNVEINSCNIATLQPSLSPIYLKSNARVVKIINNIFTEVRSLFSADSSVELDLLVIENNAFTINGTVNTVAYPTANARFKGLDIISQTRPQKAFNGDRYILNTSGTFDIVYYDYNAWNKITSTPLT